MATSNASIASKRKNQHFKANITNSGWMPFAVEAVLVEII
jgi:hypothetical protein